MLYDLTLCPITLQLVLNSAPGLNFIKHSSEHLIFLIKNLQYFPVFL